MKNLNKLKGNKITSKDIAENQPRSTPMAITNYIINKNISEVPIISEEDVIIAKNFVDSNHK